VTQLAIVASVSWGAAGSYQVLHSFTGGANDGAGPTGTLVQGKDGNFYGVTGQGGSTSDCINCGTLFSMTPAGVVTTRHVFGTQDGFFPVGGLVLASDGFFYGTASDDRYSHGTIFRFDPATDTFTVLHAFKGAPSDGSQPESTLIQASDGNLYGTTSTGGRFDGGTVFRMTPAGQLTLLFSFDPNSVYSGNFPEGGVIQGKDGYLYGTTAYGGTGACSGFGSSGCGTVFRMALDGSLLASHDFKPEQGAFPTSSLTQASDGTVWGVTYNGGSLKQCGGAGCGTIFKIAFGSQPRTLRVVHKFDGYDGSLSFNSTLLQASDGNLYGATMTGGSMMKCDEFGLNGCGTLFKVSLSGEFATVHNFKDLDGSYPNAGLVQGSDGALYGSAFDGGPQGLGVLFRIQAP
jgi:uncharacterized repeat protein (TIGR03803 family)